VSGQSLMLLGARWLWEAEMVGTVT
jgi:hypothetical protein